MSKTHASFLAAILLTAAPMAHAGALKVPEASPEVIMDIPDGWAVERSKAGFELRSPEKNSIIVGVTLARDRKALEAWRTEAAGKLKAFGIAFDPNAKAPPPPKPVAAPKPEVKADNGKSAFTTDPDRFSFSGAPSLKPPGEAGSNNPVKPADNSLENLTGFGLPAGPKMPALPFRAVQIYGASLAGKPVDVQLVIYNLPDNRMFVMMQESGSDDGRAVAMAQSVRASEATAKKQDAKAEESKPAQDADAADAKPKKSKAKHARKKAKTQDAKSETE